jgi:hypothetical protein
MLCRLLVVLMVWTPFHVAQAAMIGTDQIAVASVQSDRAAVMNALSRSDVSGQLQALGIDPATAKDRVAAMSDQEVASLAGKLNALPAGGDSAGAVLLILLVVLVWWLVK